MGNDVSKQRLDAANKTGIYNITGKESKDFPSDCLKVANLRVLTLDNCSLEKVPPEISSLAGEFPCLHLCTLCMWQEEHADVCMRESERDAHS